MGLSDRHYARDEARGGVSGPARAAAGILRRLGVVRWLVIINIAVFVIDALLGARGLTLAVHMGDRFADGMTPDRIQVLYPAPPHVPSGVPPGTAVRLDIIEARTGAKAGERDYQWMTPLQAVGHFSTAKGFLKLEVWRLVSFQFLHGSVLHLVLNLMGLWFFGPIIERWLGSGRKFLAFYLLSGICGAIMYLALNLLGYVAGTSGVRVPGLLIHDVFTPLIGASAGVFGVLMAAAHVAGRETMLVMFVLPMRISTGAYLMAGLALVNLLLGGANAGGDAAHVGGAIAGFFFIRRTHLLGEFFDVTGGADAPAPLRRPKPGAGARDRAQGDEAKLDAILDKVRDRGVQSLSRAEREFLQRASDARRDRA